MCLRKGHPSTLHWARYHQVFRQRGNAEGDARSLSSSCEVVHVSVDCRLLIRPIRMPGNGSTDLTFPVHSDRCTVLLAVNFPDTSPRLLWPCFFGISTSPQPCCGWCCMLARLPQLRAEHGGKVEHGVSVVADALEPGLRVSTTIMFQEASTCRGPENIFFCHRLPRVQQCIAHPDE